MFTHRPTLTLQLQLHNFDLFRTCRTALLRGNWQDFHRHDASRGPSAIAELLVLTDVCRFQRVVGVHHFEHVAVAPDLTHVRVCVCRGDTHVKVAVCVAAQLLDTDHREPVQRLDQLRCLVAVHRRSCPIPLSPSRSRILRCIVVVNGRHDF